MADHQEQGTDETRTLSLSRRAWLAQTGCGFGGLALAAMMAERARAGRRTPGRNLRRQCRHRASRTSRPGPDR